jgi:hypothetical protein
MSTSRDGKWKNGSNCARKHSFSECDPRFPLSIAPVSTISMRAIVGGIRRDVLASGIYGPIVSCPIFHQDQGSLHSGVITKVTLRSVYTVSTADCRSRHAIHGPEP